MVGSPLWTLGEDWPCFGARMRLCVRRLLTLRIQEAAFDYLSSLAACSVCVLKMDDAGMKEAAGRRLRVIAEHLSPIDIDVNREEHRAEGSLMRSNTSDSDSRQYATATGKPSTYEKVTVRQMREDVLTLPTCDTEPACVLSERGTNRGRSPASCFQARRERYEKQCCVECSTLCSGSRQRVEGPHHLETYHCAGTLLFVPPWPHPLCQYR